MVMGDPCDEPDALWPPSRAVPSSLRVLGLSQQGLICLSMAPLYSQNGVAQQVGVSVRAGSKPSQAQAPCSLLVWEVPPAKHFPKALGWVLETVHAGPDQEECVPQHSCG